LPLTRRGAPVSRIWLIQSKKIKHKSIQADFVDYFESEIRRIERQEKCQKPF
jgi:hypothetical protein